MIQKLHEKIILFKKMIGLKQLKKITYSKDDKTKLCQEWDLNPRPHSWTRILDCCFTEQGLIDLESGALDHSAIQTHP